MTNSNRTRIELSFSEPVSEVRWEPATRSRAIVAYALVRGERMHFEKLVSSVEDDALVKSMMRMGMEEEAGVAQIASLIDPAEKPLERLMANEIATVICLSELAQGIEREDMRSHVDRILINHASFAARLFELDPGVDLGYEELLGGAKVEPFRPEHLYIPESARSLSKDIGPDATASVQLATIGALESYIVEELRHITKVLRSKEGRETAAWLALACSAHALLLESMIDPEETPLERAIPLELAEIDALEAVHRSTEDRTVQAVFEGLIKINRNHLHELESQFRKLEGRYPGRLTKLPPWRRPSITTSDYVSHAAQKTRRRPAA